MSLKNDLYELYRKADSLEVYERMREREIKEVVRDRDELIATLNRLKEEGVYKPKEDEFVGYCKECDSPMSMKPWAKQYCHICKRDE